MLQAWISSPRGSLYFAAEATPYNLEHLRAHVYALRQKDGAETCLAINLGTGNGAETITDVAALVHELTRDGIRVRFETAGEERAVRSSPAGRRSLLRRSEGRRQRRQVQAQG